MKKGKLIGYEVGSFDTEGDTIGKWMVKKWLKWVVEGVLVGICDGEVVLFCMLDRFPVDLYLVILWETLLDCLQY